MKAEKQQRTCPKCHGTGEISILIPEDNCPLPFEDRWNGKELSGALAKRCRKVKCAFVKKVYEDGYYFKEIPKGCEFDECTARYIRRVMAFWVALRPDLKVKANRLLKERCPKSDGHIGDMGAVLKQVVDEDPACQKDMTVATPEEMYNSLCSALWLN